MTSLCNTIQYNRRTRFLGVVLWLWATAGYSAAPEDIRFQVDQFILVGELPGEADTINQLLGNAQGKSYSLTSLQALSKRIEYILHDDGYTFYRVILPPQSLADGVVNFKIIAYNLGAIEIIGNDYFDENNILRSMPALQKETPLNTHDLAETLKVANHHPAKQIYLTFKQSETEGKVDAEISVAEQRPYNISLIMNNAGTKDSGYYRITAAVQHNNLWNLDHSFNASYTTSPDHADSVIQYGFDYNAPIYPLKGWLSAYYVYSDIDTGIVAGGFNVSGTGEMYGISYQQYLPRIENYEHWLTAGLDNRFFDNNIQFEFQEIGTDVRSTPFHLGYRAEYPWKSTLFSYNVQWLRNVGYGSYNSALDYNLARLGADNNWDAFRYGFDISSYLGEWLFKLNFNGQHSPDLLIPGEQIGLGGTYSVRGYQERETSADSGQVLRLEVNTPHWYGIYLASFFDYGHGRQTATLPEEPSEWNIGSLGFGGRWQWRNYIFVSVDLAFALMDAPQTQEQNTRAGDNRVHASIILRY